MKHIFTILLAGAAAATFAAEPLIKADSPRSFTGTRYFTKEADGTLLCQKTCYAVSRKKVAIDPAKQYLVSCEVKGNGNVRIGVNPHTADGRPASIAGLQAVDGTETTLIAPVKKTDKSFKVKDASKWSKSSARVVYDADFQKRDLPNFNFFGGRIKSIAKDADGYIITLTGQVGIDLTPGAVVRQHLEGRPAIFGNPIKLTGDWQTVKFTLGPGISPKGTHSNRVFPGVGQIALWLSVPKGAVIRNFQVVEVEK